MSVSTLEKNTLIYITNINMLMALGEVLFVLYFTTYVTLLMKQNQNF